MWEGLYLRATRPPTNFIHRRQEQEDAHHQEGKNANFIHPPHPPTHPPTPQIYDAASNQLLHTTVDKEIPIKKVRLTHPPTHPPTFLLQLTRPPTHPSQTGLEERHQDHFRTRRGRTPRYVLLLLFPPTHTHTTQLIHTTFFPSIQHLNHSNRLLFSLH